MAYGTKLTRDEFRDWVRQTRPLFERDVIVSPDLTRQWAEKVRPHDPTLAELYDQLADSRDALAVYMRREL